MSKPQLQICNKLLPTRSSSATVTTSSSFLLLTFSHQVLSWHFYTPGWHQSNLLNVMEWVSQSVSDWQALPMIGLGSDKNYGLRKEQGNVLDACKIRSDLRSKNILLLRMSELSPHSLPFRLHLGFQYNIAINILFLFSNSFSWFFLGRLSFPVDSWAIWFQSKPLSPCIFTYL